MPPPKPVHHVTPTLGKSEEASPAEWPLWEMMMEYERKAGASIPFLDPFC